MNIKPLSRAFAAEVCGVELGEALTEAGFASIREAWLQYGVLVFHDTDLDEASFVAFSRRFGEPETPPADESFARGRSGVAEHPEIYIISNVLEGGRPIGGLGAGEAEWHTDMSYMDHPPTASLLLAREVPSAGGDTWFADMRAALERLPPALRRRLGALSAKHDSAYTSAGELRKGAERPRSAADAQGAIHPLIRTHPETGRDCLFLGRRRNASVVGIGPDEGESLLDEIWRRGLVPETVYRHRWRVGDLVVWDNRATMHRRDSFSPDERRLMLRTQIRGDAPAGAVGGGYRAAG